MKTPLPFGAWPSAVSARSATASGLSFQEGIFADDGDLYWGESRTAEGGRTAIVRRSASGEIADVGPEGFNARTLVHEYGGGAFCVAGGIVYASSFADQRIYRIQGGDAAPITPEPERPRDTRYADLTLGPEWAIAVRERHGGDEPVNDLVRIDLGGASEPVAVAGGHDFFAAPRLSPDGSRLAWLTWDHPAMPWDGTILWLATLGPDGDVTEPEAVAGGRDESVFQPAWSPDGVLHFVSDRTGWWNLYRHTPGGAEALHPAEEEFGVPHWLFGTARYGFLADGRLVATPVSPSGDRLVLVTDTGTKPIPLPHAAFRSSIATGDGTVFLAAMGPDRPTSLIAVDVDTGDWETVREPEAEPLDEGYLSIPEFLTFDTPDGPAHSLFYPPASPDYEGPPGEKPPVIVSIHGGPTSAGSPNLDMERIFWTSRGFGVLAVHHGGSTHSGREFRRRLDGRWGEVDVRDCALAASSLAESGRCDPDRMLIHGGSAGGYTALMALALHDSFAAGAAYYPVTDLAGLATDTHKFESRYLDRLVGPYPEAEDLYRERSPLTHIDQIRAPVLLLQGADDTVVPPSQPRAMRDALRKRGVPVGYVEFPGEGHGFRSAEARTRALESELWFYGWALGFEPADSLEPVGGLSEG